MSRLHSENPVIQKRIDMGRALIREYGTDYTEEVADAIAAKYSEEATVCWIIALDFVDEFLADEGGAA